MGIIARVRTRRLVRELYRSILGREPDPDGARVYESLVRKLGPERAIPKMLEAFRQSEEYHRRADAWTVSHINSTLASRGGQQLIDGQPVAHLVSLGSYCLPAQIFKDAALKQYSLPFDWIFSTPQMVRDCLADDFAIFLDRRYYRSISRPGKDPAAEHRIYGERYGLPGLFAHRDPVREADYLYLVRCVTRFRQLLRSDAAKLFFIISRVNHNLPNEFPLLLETLSRATQNFVLLCVELLDPAEPDSSALTPVARTGDHALYRFMPSSFDAERGFLPDKLDEWSLLRLVYRYKLALRESPWGSENAQLEHVPADHGPML